MSHTTGTSIYQTVTTRNPPPYLNDLVEKILHLLVHNLGANIIINLGAILITHGSWDGSETPFLGQLRVIIGAHPGQIHGRVLGGTNSIV